MTSMQGTMPVVRTRALFLSVLIGMLAPASGPAQSQIAGVGNPVSFFFDEFPNPASLSMSLQTQPVTIAKVRVGNVAYLRNRHGENLSGIDSLFGAGVEIIEILTGPNTERKLDVYFGSPGGKSKYPRSKQAREKNYVIAFYRNENGRYQLIGMPISQKQYNDWDEDFWKSQTERERPGTR